MSSKNSEIRITSSTGQAYFDFKRAIADVTDGIVNEATEALDLAKEETAEWASREVAQNALDHGWGEYSKGWTYKAESKKRHKWYFVYNKTHANLTHLLENGHRIVTVNGEDTGKRSKAFKHIAPVNAKLAEVIDFYFKEYFNL